MNMMRYTTIEEFIMDNNIKERYVKQMPEGFGIDKANGIERALILGNTLSMWWGTIALSIVCAIAAAMFYGYFGIDALKHLDITRAGFEFTLMMLLEIVFLGLLLNSIRIWINFFKQKTYVLKCSDIKYCVGVEHGKPDYVECHFDGSDSILVIPVGSDEDLYYNDNLVKDYYVGWVKGAKPILLSYEDTERVFARV